MAKEQEEKVKAIETDELRIGDNSFSYKKSFVQLSNISQVLISPVPKLKYPLRYIVICVIGILVCLMNALDGTRSIYLSMTDTLFPLAGAVAAVICGILLYRIYTYNKNCGEYLVLNLNSGKNLYFEGNNPRFLIEIMNVIRNCIDDRSLSYVINMNECQIETIHQIGNDNILNE